MAVTACVLAVLLATAHGFSLQSPSGPLVAQLGGSVLLPCAAEAPLPLEELEVEWRRADSGALLHLFQEGGERPESQDDAYRGRAHFFPVDMAKGNFSILLKNVSEGDIGVYSCKVYTEHEAEEARVNLVRVEFLMVHGLAHTALGHVGGEVVLDCFVESHVPPEELEEVKWKRTDQDILVLLYQDGVVLSDSSHERYVGRTEFFTTEISKGNFSLRLGRLRTEDKGEYVCEAHHGLRSGNKTVELQSLRLSALHHMIWLLCTIAFGFSIASLVHFIQSKKASDWKAMRVHISLVIVPNIVLCVAFILWGVCSEGFTDEVALCATVCLTRVVCCFWISPHLDKFPECLQSSIKIFGILVQYSAITTVFYLVAFINRKRISFLGHTIVQKWEFEHFFGLIPFFCLCGLVAVSIRVKCPFLYCIEEKEKRPHGIFSFLFMELSSLFQILFISLITSSFNPATGIALCVILAFQPLSLVTIRYLRKRLLCTNLLWTITMAVLVPLYMAVYLWVLYQVQDFVQKVFPYERDGVMAVTALLKVLTAMSLLEHPGDCEVSVNGSTPHLIVYGFGATVLSAVNAIALTGELILKASMYIVCECICTQSISLSKN